MSNFKNIQEKLHDFISKYYTNEIIKGSILFISFGLLYFILTLFVEYFLWLRPTARTFLFWFFLFVEFGLLIKFILIPLLKLLRIQKGISSDQASKIIGKHFNKIDDKLLNLLQLNKSKANTDLLEASIEQKSSELRLIPFKKAIDFRLNLNYLKFLVVPLVIGIVIFLSGNISIFRDSLNRVVHHNTAYLPPAPFSFQILNDKLVAIEDVPFVLKVSTIGKMKPNDIKIIFDNETYYLSNNNLNDFFYEFERPNKSFQFYLEANEVVSMVYDVEVIKTPKIINFEMRLDYPSYTLREDETIKNTGNAMIPEGTKVGWTISTEHTIHIDFISQERNKGNKIKPSKEALQKERDGKYNLTKTLRTTIDYEISTSNSYLKNFEVLNYQLKVIKDQYPKIFIKSDIDSVTRGPVNFAGQIKDDYGISHVQVLAKNLKDNSMSIYSIDTGNSDFEEFFYTFPKGISLEEGVSYEIYFLVFDNDAVNGSKKSKSQTFYYQNKSQQEVEEELIIEQKQNMEEMEKASKNFKDLQKSLKKFGDKLKSKNNSEWNDEKQLEDFIERQKAYQEILDKNRENILRNMDEMERSEDPKINEKNDDLRKRIEESKELDEKERMLRELQELTEKLKKENLLEKAEKLENQAKRQERSLERILELTKQFYVQKKAEQIIKKLDELSKSQNELTREEDSSPEQQEELNKKFDSIQKNIEELRKQNDELKNPKDIPETSQEEKSIKKEMDQAKSSLEIKRKDEQQKAEAGENAKKSQNAAAKKMKELSEKMKMQMAQMEMEGSDENIKDLQQILENLLIFSFDQESLMISMEGINSGNAEYPEKLKRQQTLKEYFEHIDDSLFTLSMRIVKLSAKIDQHVYDVHYNLDRSLESIAENKIEKGTTHQRYTMTAANELADMLSNVLQSLQNSKPGSNKGKGKKGESIELPDIIQKQENLIEKMKAGMQQSSSKEGQTKEQMSGRQFQIYQEQKKLRDQLNDLLEKGSEEGNKGKNAMDKMEEIEKLLLEKGLTTEVLQAMQKLNQELLKLEKANYSQGRDMTRRADQGRNSGNTRTIKKVESQRLFFKQNEILLRNSLPLQPNYQDKVKNYFKTN